jgi:hypothetical protein
VSSREAWWANNATSANTNFEWGPQTAAGVYKLIRLDIEISFGFVGVTATPPSYFYAPTAWGVHYVPSGDSPLVVPTNLSSFQFLCSGLTFSDAVGVASWAPNTDDGNVITFATVKRSWYGQRVMDGDIDLWVSYAPVVSGSGDLVASWLMTAEWI